MTLKHRNRGPRPKTFCPKCHQRGIVTVKLPSGATLCLPCIRESQPVAYMNITLWVKEHPPIDGKS